jgi:NAD(P)H-quinone oxidoreductase subunit 4L
MTKNNESVKTMNSSAVPVSIAFAIVVVGMLGLYIGGHLVIWLQNLGLNSFASYPELFVFVAIILLAMLAAAMPGSHRISIISITAFAGLLALTYNQEILVKYLTLAALLFSMGMYGMITSRNAVRVLMSIELMLNAVNLNLVAFARYVDPVHVRGQIFAIFILTVAAAEAAVGLAIVLAIYRNTATVDMEKFNLLKW